MSSATISSNGVAFDQTIIQTNLCQKYLNKVSATLEEYFEFEKEDYLPFCLIDFSTLEIYPLQNMNVAYSVRDYWIALNHSNSETKVHVYYLPER